MSLLIQLHRFNSLCTLMRIYIHRYKCIYLCVYVLLWLLSLLLLNTHERYISVLLYICILVILYFLYSYIHMLVHLPCIFLYVYCNCILMNLLQWGEVLQLHCFSVLFPYFMSVTMHNTTFMYIPHWAMWVLTCWVLLQIHKWAPIFLFDICCTVYAFNVCRRAYVWYIKCVCIYTQF